MDFELNYMEKYELQAIVNIETSRYKRLLEFWLRELNNDENYEKREYFEKQVNHYQERLANFENLCAKIEKLEYV